ncbi:hypothetical protein [Rhizobium ruizarguesonis]|uniref:hypothetical protein n=1 Tax=Rhizobium ruizarguesonis TaxID=2081791 RepID=UPI00040FF74C|nr:hypothetical protein [Rhizobium ruizarguesonis]QJS29306.1 hypothetical protein RLTA1_19205 [Rhizobium leguminosarum bv. trifolii TA1]UFW93465.1 hypothetical protein RlegTA1_19165 [Rhizobium ruizarguesonis]
MARRRVSPVDLLAKPNPTVIHAASKSHPLLIHSPTHSIPGKKPKCFNLRVLGDFGGLGKQIALAFVVSSAGDPVRTADSRVVALRSLFSHVAALAKAKSMNLPSMSADMWRQSVSSWFVSIKADHALADITCNSYLSTCRDFFETLNRKGLVPKFQWPASIPDAKNKHRPGISSTILSDATPAEVASWPKLDQLDWKKLQALEASLDPQVRLRRSDIIKNAVRRHAEYEIREWWHLFEDTRSMISTNDNFDFDDYCERFEALTNGRITRRRGWQAELSLFPNALVYIDRKFGGVLPGMADDPHFLKFVYNVFGKASITGRFHLEYESLISLLTLILMEEPIMNFSSPLSMKTSDLEAIVGNEHRGRWTKRRANYRRLKTDMPTGSRDSLARGSPEKISAAQALLVIDELSKPLRPYAVIGVENNLCLVRTFVQQKSAAWSPLPNVLNRHWNTFRLRSGILSKLGFTLSQFRPTGAIEIYLETGDMFKVAEKLGQQDVRTAAKYVQGLEANSIDAANTRPVQEALVVGSANTSGRSASDFGVSEERRSEILRTAHSAGFFGYNISGTDSEAATKVSLFERILSGLKLFVFETPEVAAEIIAFRQHIIDNGKAIQGTVRYEDFWFPILISCSHLIDLMSPKVVRDAKKLLLQRPIHYGPVI